MLAHLGLATNRLIRVSYGPFQLGDLADGELREIRGRILRDQLGAKLAKAAGVDFEPCVRRPGCAGEGDTAAKASTGPRRARRRREGKRAHRRR